MTGPLRGPGLARAERPFVEFGDVAYPRCHRVYAVAPEGTTAREANDRLNAFVEASGRGVPVFHDHFTGGRHGGVAVFEVRNAGEEAQLGRLGPLRGWEVEVHALTFSLTGVGFAAQTDLTIEVYGKTSLDALRRGETEDPRFWWRRRQRSQIS